MDKDGESGSDRAKSKSSRPLRTETALWFNSTRIDMPVNCDGQSGRERNVRRRTVPGGITVATMANVAWAEEVFTNRANVHRLDARWRRITGEAYPMESGGNRHVGYRGLRVYGDLGGTGGPGRRRFGGRRPRCSAGGNTIGSSNMYQPRPSRKSGAWIVRRIEPSRRAIAKADSRQTEAFS